MKFLQKVKIMIKFKQFYNKYKVFGKKNFKF